MFILSVNYMLEMNSLNSGFFLNLQYGIWTGFNMLLNIQMGHPFILPFGRLKKDEQTFRTKMSKPIQDHLCAVRFPAS